MSRPSVLPVLSVMLVVIAVMMELQAQNVPSNNDYNNFRQSGPGIRPLQPVYQEPPRNPVPPAGPQFPQPQQVS
jgi:hypothetical protein